MITLFLQSLLIGFVVAIPVGPAGALCIDQSLRGGIRIGVAAGIGAALADATFGFISCFGCPSYLSNFSNTSFFRIITGLIVIFIGIKNLKTTAISIRPQSSVTQIRSATITTFLLTISNPATILSFAGIFLMLGITTEESTWKTASLLSIGIFIGSTMWGLFLSVLANCLKKRLNLRISLFSKISGIMMISFGVAILSSILLIR